MKKLVSALLVAIVALSLVGCGRSAQFGVVDMKKIESDSPVYKSIKEDMTAKAQALQQEMINETSGKSQEEAQKVVQEKSAKMQALQTEAQNKLKGSFDAALGEVAKEKKLSAVLVKDAVPQGGVDVTEDVLKKMK